MPEAQDARKTRHLSLIARIVIATAAIAWVLHGQDWGELARVFKALDLWYFVLTVAVYVVAQLIIAWRWWFLLRAQSIHIEIIAAVRLFFLGLFYNNVMPGSVGGDVLKAWYVTKHTHRRFEGALSVVVDRVIGLSGTLIMAIVAYLFFVRGKSLGATAADGGGAGEWFLRNVNAIVWVVLAVLAVLGVLLVLPYSRVRLQRLAAGIWCGGAALLGRTRDAIAVYCSKPWTLLGALLLTLIAQSIVVAAFWLLGRNMGIAAGPKYYFVVFPVTWVVAAVPVSVAGLGVLEAGIVELFTRLAGATAGQALALAFCQRFVWVLASLPGALIHLLGAHLPREIFVDSENPPN